MLISLLTLAACSTLGIAAPSISVSLSGANTVTDVDNFRVVAAVTNTGDETLNLLRDPNSLLASSWATNSFDIASVQGIAPGFKGVAVCVIVHVATAIVL